jgi:teichuronic acid biosynthesis glycosyltransferase TuaG
MELISVIMPYYKKKDFFLESIQSVLRQTYQNFEIIIVYDDPNIIDLKFILEIKKLDKRIKVIKNYKNLGVGISRNIGISYSDGFYLAFLDCDDIWYKDKLEVQINFMKKNKISFSYTSYDVINSKNIIIDKRKVPEKITFNDLLQNCNIGLSTVIMKKKLISQNCKFPKLKTKEDFVLWLILAKSMDLHGINLSLSKWRKLNNSLSSYKFQKIKDGFNVYKKYMKFSYLKSCLYLMILSINFLKKNLY